MKWEDQTTKLQSLTIIKGTVGVINENNLYNKTRHSYIYIFVAYSRPNGWTDWAEIVCGHSWVAGGCYRLKKLDFFFQNIFFFYIFFHGQRRALQLVFIYLYVHKLTISWPNCWTELADFF